MKRIHDLERTTKGYWYYKNQDPSYEQWESLAEFIKREVLVFCGCGDYSSIIYIKHFLDLCKKRDWKDYDDMNYMFMCNWADKEGYTEHGTTVRCSWLTEEGRALLSDINWVIKNETDSFK